MGRKKREEIESSDVIGLKYFDKLSPLFERLHEVGCDRDRAGKRNLHMDQYCMLMLLFLFNPIVTSLRALQQASELKKVQRKLGCLRASLGSLSEATDVFDPERLQEIIGELAEQLKPIQNVGQGHVDHVLTAVDGTIVKTLSTIVEATYLKNSHGEPIHGWRFHGHFDIDRYVPTRMDVTGGANAGKSNEKNVLRKVLEPDHCYVMDRYYAQFRLFNDIADIGSSYVCRIRDNSNLTNVQQENAVSDKAKKAGVLSDIVVKMGAKSRAAAKPNHLIRVILVKTTPRKNRGKGAGKKGAPESDGILRIATNLLDVPAEVIAEIYRQRWTIETFFKFFKHILGCRHLLSQDPVGIEIQVYCAIIACMLISLWTGRKPTLRTYEMICFYFTGLADEEELLAHISKLKPHDA